MPDDGREGRPPYPCDSPRRRCALCTGVAAAVLLTSACNLIGPLRTGPEGQSVHSTDLRQMARDGRFSEAVDLTDPDYESQIGDELLRLMQRGLLLHYAGRYRESNDALQAAELIIEERFTKRISLALLSMVTSDRALAWVPEDTERLLVNYYGALNYLALDDPEEAAVEARRLSRLLELSEDEVLQPAEARMRRTMRYFAASVFEAAGEANDAAVAYRHVWPPAAEPQPDDPARPRFLDLYGEETFIGPPEAGGDVVVMLERGFVAHRVERSANLPLFPEEIDALQASNTAVRYAAVMCVASRGLSEEYDFERMEQEEAARWHRDSDGRCVVEGAAVRESDENGGGETNRDFYLMRVAWPEMVRSGLPPARAGRFSVQAGLSQEATSLASASPAEPPQDGGEHPAPAGPALSASVSESVMSDFEDRLGGILLKMVARTALKYELARAVESELSEKNEALGDMGLFAANVAAAIFERADTRSWHLLPDEVSIVRLRLPAGRHPLKLTVEPIQGGAFARFGPPADGSKVIDLGEVEVREGAVHLLSARVWS